MTQGDLFEAAIEAAPLPRVGQPPEPSGEPPFQLNGDRGGEVTIPRGEAMIDLIARVPDIQLASLVRTLDANQCELTAEERLLLYFRVATQAAARGVTWTPALDALACSWFWPVGDGVVERLEGRYHVSAHPPEAWASGLRSWIERQTDAAALFRLIRFRSDRVHAEVARHARCATVGLVLALAGDADRMLDLALNPALKEAELDALRDAIIDRIRNISSARSIELTALAVLQRRGSALSPDVFDEIHTLVSEEERLRSRDTLRTLSQFHLPWRPALRR